MTTSYQIADNLYLVNQAPPSKGAVKVEVPPSIDNILVLDCSGSMSYDLPKIREQIKRKVPKLLREQDTISIIWFSGRKEYGVLLEAEPVATLKDLQTVEQAIDRWLRPVGLTGFLEPLQEVCRLAERLSKQGSGRVINLTFFSDGCDNQWSRGQILEAVENVAGMVGSATFVEYGYYADRNLLSQMAEKCGGNLIFSEDFDRYQPTFEALMQKKPTGARRIEVPVKGDVIGGFAFALVDGDLVTYSVGEGAVTVPEDLRDFWYLAPTTVGPLETPTAGFMAAAYAAVSLFATRMNSNVVWPLLKALGDVTFIDTYASCFGKQKYSEFMLAAQAAAFDPTLRFTQGCNPNKVPKEDAFTVLDLLRVLASDDSNCILVDSKDFRYSKIGRGRIDAGEALTAEEQAEIQRLTEEMTQTRDSAKIKVLTEKIAAVTANKQDALKFEADKQEHGYPIASLTYNEERPNISFLVNRKGTVDLSSRLASGPSGIPEKFPTQIWRNYTVIKDGLVNLDRLPVRLTAGTIRSLKEAGMPIEVITACEGETDAQARLRAAKASDDRPVNVVFDLKQLPIINRRMVTDVSAKELFEKEFELTKARAAQKVYNTFYKEHFPKISEGLAKKYGDDAAKWLKEQGLTDSGFNPKSVQAEATDFYMGKELRIALKGLATLPSVKEVRDKMAKGKLTPSAALMAPYITEVDDFLSSETYVKSTKKEKLLEGWFDGQTLAAKHKVRALLSAISQIKFAIVVGQTWPVEFKSLDENQLTITVDGQSVEARLEMKEVQIKI